MASRSCEFQASIHSRANLLPSSSLVIGRSPPNFKRIYTRLHRFRLAEFVIGRKEAVDVLAQQIVRRGEADLGWSTAADADFLLRPQPVLEVGHGVGSDVDGGDAATERGIGRRP